MSTREPVQRQARPRSPGVDVRPGSVREARLGAGLSLAKLAGQELSRGAIHLIESERSRPSIATLKLIASRTNKPISFFLASASALELHVSRPLAIHVSSAERLCLAGQFERAVDRCEAVLAEVVDPYTEARLRVCLGRAALGLRRPVEARAHLQQAASQLRALDDPWQLAECLALIASAAHGSSEPEALTLAEDAIAACRELDPVPQPTLARAYTTAGDVLAREQRWNEAIQKYQLGLEQSACTTLPQLSRLYEDLSQAKDRHQGAVQAAEWSLKATAMHEAQRDLGVRATIHLKLGDALLADQQPDPALYHYQEAQVECDRFQLEESKARVLLAQALLCVTEGQTEESERLASHSAKLAEQVGDRRCLALARCLLGRLAAAGSNLAGRDREFRTAFELLTGPGDHEELIDAHVAYAELLEVSGQTNEALHEWKQAMKLSRPHMQRLATNRAPAAPAIG